MKEEGKRRNTRRNENSTEVEVAPGTPPAGPEVPPRAAFLALTLHCDKVILRAGWDATGISGRQDPFDNMLNRIKIKGNVFDKFYFGNLFVKKKKTLSVENLCENICSLTCRHFGVKKNRIENISLSQNLLWGFLSWAENAVPSRKRRGRALAGGWSVLR